MQEQLEICGFILVDKPNGRTSSDCVQEIRHIVGKKIRVGHAGTLDAFATGLLVIGIGRQATKDLSSIMTLDKIYTARAKLGQLTDTLDITGHVIEDNPSDVSIEQIRKAAESLVPGYRQTPPVYSALKYKGKALSRLARKEILTHEALATIADEKSRDIKLYSCTLTGFEQPFFSIKAHVSHGTYIRSLMNDIAHLCNTYATTHDLRRVAIGPFSVNQAKPLQDLSTREIIETHAIKTDAMRMILENYTRI